MVTSLFFALIARIILDVLFILMAVFFWHRYKQANNKYFMGYFTFFVILTIVQFGVFLSDLSQFISGSSSGNLFSINFTNYNTNRTILINVVTGWGLPNSIGQWLSNFIQIQYIIIIIIALIAIGTQVQPLEIILKEHHHILSRFFLFWSSFSY